MSADIDKLIAMQAQVDELARIASDAVREKNALAAALEAAEEQRDDAYLDAKEWMDRCKAAETQRDTLARAVVDYIGDEPFRLLAERDGGKRLIGSLASPAWVRLVEAAAPFDAALAAVTPPEEDE